VIHIVNHVFCLLTKTIRQLLMRQSLVDNTIPQSDFRISSMHTIHLRDPWQRQPAESGGTRWTRAFHRPTGISERENVWLVISDSTVPVWLGDQLLTASDPGQGGRYDITTLLGNFNRLAIEVLEADVKRSFEVWLEIGVV
jgi:hypothetical protein